MSHALPPRWQQEHQHRATTYAQGLDQAVTGTRRWKTSDVQKRNQRTRFQPYTKTATAINQFQAAKFNSDANKQILQTPEQQKQAAVGGQADVLAKAIGKQQEEQKNVEARKPYDVDKSRAWGDPTWLRLYKVYERMKDEGLQYDQAIDELKQTGPYNKLVGMGFNQGEIEQHLRGMIPGI